MTYIRHRSTLFYLALFVIGVQCDSPTFRSQFFRFDDIKNDIRSLNSINISSVISEFTSQRDWMKNRNCLAELSAIKDGFENYEEWAFKLVDAWGKFPSAIMDGNYFDLGSFSQCFHIQRNGMDLKTKYCIGQLKFYADEPMPRSKVWPRLDVGPGISIGMCLPLACSIEHLETIANRVIQTKVRNMTVKIPENTCQIEESTSQFNSTDYAAIALLGVVCLLMVASTAYDVFCSSNNRSKSASLLAFSIYTNGRKLFSYRNSNDSDEIQCLHGIRVISTLWIVLGHVCSMVGLLPIQNRGEVVQFIGRYHSTIAYTLWLAVENFFILSGLLASYHMFTLLKKNGKLNIISIYLHRYLRLTPLLAACFLLTMSLLRFTGSGPVWPITLEFLSGGCKQYWWSSLLYTQNYVNPTQICLINTWYVSADMQLYLIAPFLVYLLHRFKAKALIAFLVLISVGCWNIIALHVKHNLRDLGEGIKIELTYFPTHTRFISWLIGFVLGYILVEFPKGSFQIPKKLNWFALSVSVGAFPLIMGLYYPLQQLNSASTPLDYGIYEALIGRICWPIALCYIVFASFHSCGGVINWFLAHPYWQPLSKLSYGMNLLNYAVMTITIGSMKAVPHPTELSNVLSIVENSLLTCLAATIATLAFEIPSRNIVYLITQRRKTHRNSVDVKVD